MNIFKKIILALVTVISLPSHGMLKTLNLIGVIKIIRINARDIKNEDITTCVKIANKLAPCILMIDDFDFLNLQRNRNTVLLSDVLRELNTINSTKPVIIIGSATKIENLDSSIMQHAKVLYYDYSRSRVFFIIHRT